MAKAHHDYSRSRSRRRIRTTRCRYLSALNLLLMTLSMAFILALYTGMTRRRTRRRGDRNRKAASAGIVEEKSPLARIGSIAKTETSRRGGITSLADLEEFEIHPKATSSRYLVDPPKDTLPITLVLCSTTKGNLFVLVHESWAPKGARRFLEMVDSKYFNSKVALMRCVRNFLCQFGIAGKPELNKFKPLEDDPNWLPEGPAHRTNDKGVKRFSRGFLAYAGGGKNSRTNQLILALGDNERLGGGSPWEVPWGEIIGEESFKTLSKIHTGYGEKGPSQGRLRKEGSSKEIERDFPLLDYILDCNIIDTLS